MAKQRIEPRLGDGSRAANDEPERFIVEPRLRPHAAQSQLARPADHAPDGLRRLRRLAWVVALLGLGALAGKGIAWYAEQSDSPALQSFVERLEHSLAGAREQMLGILARERPRASSLGRELSERCEALGRAFVADPQPEVREQMLQACQAYEQYRQTGQAPN